MLLCDCCYWELLSSVVVLVVWCEWSCFDVAVVICYVVGLLSVVFLL